MAKSHVTFTADCQLKSVEERQKKPKNPTETPESYWTIRDHDNVTYIAYGKQRREVRILEQLLPENPDMMSPPVRLEGYVSQPNGGKFLCLLHVKVWNSDTNTYDTPENPAEEMPVVDAETEELEALYRERFLNE